jgi:hypothetical protein
MATNGRLVTLPKIERWLSPFLNTIEKHALPWSVDLVARFAVAIVPWIVDLLDRARGITVLPDLVATAIQDHRCLIAVKTDSVVMWTAGCPREIRDTAR